METTLSKILKWVEKELESYKEHPVFSEWDRGYSFALDKVKELIEQDGRYKKAYDELTEIEKKLDEAVLKWKN